MSFHSGRLTIDVQPRQFELDGLVGRKQITLDDVVNAKAAWIKEGSEGIKIHLSCLQ